MIHASYYRPRVYPYNGDTVAAEIDRLQELTGALTLNREKVKEIGRDGTVGWLRRTPSLRLTLRQHETGNLEFFRKLTNLGDSVTSIVLNDFKTSMTDIAGYKTDDDGTFLGTVVYPKLRCSSFGIQVGDPDSLVERNFELVGEDEWTFLNNNKYFICHRGTTASAGVQTITLNDPSPTESPDESGNDGYIIRVLRIRAGVTTELVYATDYSFAPPSTLSINAAAVGDVYKTYYTASAYVGGSTPFTNNDSDVAALMADSTSIWLQTTNYLYKVQSVGINVTFDRTDYKEVGNSTVVQRGVRNKTVNVTLGRVLEAYTIEQVLRGVASTYGKIDPRRFTSNNTLTLQLFSDSTKNLFKQEFRLTGLTPTSLDAGNTVDEYVNRGVTMECEDLTISSVKSI